MSASDPILRRLHACVLARVPAFLISVPGTGKTERVASYCRARGMHMERWLLSRCEPIDIKPRIYFEGRVIVGRPPEIERATAFAAEPGSPGSCLFTDELNLATRETEGATLDIVDNPPPGVAVIAAGNPPTRGQAARALGAAASNRFCHLHVEPDALAWANAQVGGWPEGANDFDVPDQEVLKKANAKAATLVGSFIRKRGDLLQKCPDNTVEAGKPWPSARSWDMTKRVHGVALALNLPADDVLALIRGCVGDGPAVEYLSYCNHADLMDPEDVLKDPPSFKPDIARVDRTVATITGVAGAIERELTSDRWEAAWKLGPICLAADVSDGAMLLTRLLIEAYSRKSKKDPASIQGIKAPQSFLATGEMRRIALALAP